MFLLILPLDSLADTFHSIGLVMRLCQLLSVLEILHILIGIDKSRLLPRFLQVSWFSKLSFHDQHTSAMAAPGDKPRLTYPECCSCTLPQAAWFPGSFLSAGIVSSELGWLGKNSSVNFFLFE